MGLSASLSRPLMTLFDRNFDLSLALQQPWTYKPLLQDVLGLKLNKVSLVGEAGPGQAGPDIMLATIIAVPPVLDPAASARTYDVDETDFFWQACGSHDFPKVAEEVETQLRLYREKVDEINKKATAGPQMNVDRSVPPGQHAWTATPLLAGIHADEAASCWDTC
eukprot:364397-Chlamydomonas_euryale.AAC.11